MEDRIVVDLTPHPFNLQVYGQPDDGLKKNMDSFGLNRPIAIDEQNQILSGARRWAAAKALGWDRISVEVMPLDTEAAVHRFILIENHYRNVKTTWMRRQEADEYRRLLKAGEITTDELADLAREKKRAPSRPEDEKPEVIAVLAADLSPSTYQQVSFIADPDRAEASVDRAQQMDDISPTHATQIKQRIRKHRKNLQRDRVSASRAAHDVRSAMRHAREEHGQSSDEELRMRETDRAFDSMIRAGDKFAGALRMLQHDARVRHLTTKHAFRLATVIEEIRDATRVLLAKADKNFDEDDRRKLGEGMRQALKP